MTCLFPSADVLREIGEALYDEAFDWYERAHEEYQICLCTHEVGTYWDNSDWLGDMGNHLYGVSRLWAPVVPADEIPF
jgi:hypothetical protein